MKHKKKNDTDNRTAAMIALSLDDSSTGSECISDEVMAAIIDQRLDEKERADVIAHLNGCDECLHRCSGIVAAVSEKRKSFLSKSLPALAAACVLLICIYIPFMETSAPISIVEDSYKNIAAYREQKGLPAPSLAVDLPWEKKNNSYGFNSGAALSESQIAFLGGMYSGKQMLAPDTAELPEFLKPERGKIESSWEGTSLKVNFKLGKWCYLMKIIAEKRIETDGRFSENQSGYLSGVIEALEKQTDTEEKAKRKLRLARLKKLQRYFAAASNTDSGIKWRNLGKETDILVHLMIY